MPWFKGRQERLGTTKSASEEASSQALNEVPEGSIEKPLPPDSKDGKWFPSRRELRILWSAFVRDVGFTRSETHHGRSTRDVNNTAASVSGGNSGYSVLLELETEEEE